MDERRFDEISRVLAGGLSRRRVLRSAATGLAAALGWRAHGVGAQPAKNALCHATDSATNPWVVIDVAEPAWAAHLGHGDRAFVDCCDDTDCAAPQTCGGGGVEGACGCTPTFTVENCDGVTCGDIPNGCGATVTCGCIGFETCGGDGIAGQCGCTDDGTACGETVCGTATNNCGVTVACGPLGGACPDGQSCQDGVCPPPLQDLQLFGTFIGDGAIFVDDDLRVEINGVVIFNDADNTADFHSPISFSARNGDTLRIVATNGTLPNFNIHLDPLALRRVSDGATQVLDSAGVPGFEVAPIGVFYDESFTIALP